MDEELLYFLSYLLYVPVISMSAVMIVCALLYAAARIFAAAMQRD